MSLTHNISLRVVSTLTGTSGAAAHPGAGRPAGREAGVDRRKAGGKRDVFCRAGSDREHRSGELRIKNKESRE